MKKTLIVLVSVLVLAVAVLAFLNRDYADERRALEEEAAFIVREAGEIRASYTLDDLQAMDAVEFEAVFDTSDSDPVTYRYEGVELARILAEAGIEGEGYTSVVLSAVDGYAVAYGMDEVLAPENVYLAFAREGELLASREEGGRGPYQTIVVSDAFSNRRCKHAIEMDVN